MDLFEFRNEYLKGGLERDMLDDNPFVQFKKWFEPYDIDEETAKAIIRPKCPNINLAQGLHSVPTCRR